MALNKKFWIGRHPSAHDKRLPLRQDFAKKRPVMEVHPEILSPFWILNNAAVALPKDRRSTSGGSNRKSGRSRMHVRKYLPFLFDSFHAPDEDCRSKWPGADHFVAHLGKTSRLAPI